MMGDRVGVMVLNLDFEQSNGKQPRVESEWRL